MCVLVAAKSLRTLPPAIFGSCVLELFHISLMSVEFTPSKRGRVLQLHELNYSYREIEKITGVSKTTAQETVKQDENCNTRESLPRSGRPKAVNHRERRHILQQVCQH
jgi:transposase